MAIGDQLTCSREGCDEEFISKTHNQKYHDDECCRLATNAKIMQKYYDRKNQRMGIPRACSVCESKLSKYNSSKICNTCELKIEKNRKDEVLSMLYSISIS